MLFRFTTFLFAMMISTPPVAAADYFEPKLSSLLEEDLRNTYPPPQIEVGSNILLVGDSLALGLSRHFHLLAKQAGYVPYSRAISGSTTPEWSRLIKQDLKMYKPQLVIISLGTNDALLSENTLQRRANSYNTLVETIEKSGAKVLWIMPPELPKRFARTLNVNDLILHLNVDKFDSSSIQIERSDDQVHPTANGYKDWMDSIWWWMADNNYIYEGC